jgi:hypothetical protein
MGERMKELYAAFIKAQKEIKTALKDSKNPHFKSTYADLESVWDACRDALHKHGLGIMQLTDIDASGVPVLVTRIVHESGQHVEGRYPLLSKDANNPQTQLAALTYARRGAMAAACGIVQSDDDGNTAAGHVPPRLAPPVQQNGTTAANVTLSAHGKTMADIETVVGAKQQAWTESQKEKARSIFLKLKEGTPWNEAVK